MSFFTGTPARHEQISMLQPNQQPLYNQLVNAGINKGAGGAFGTAADYYRDLLSDDSQTYNQMIAPELRRYREQIIPELSEQFSGYGGIGSSSFRNAATAQGTDLAERLGSLRAQLRMQGAQGLSNIGQQGLQNYAQNVYYPGQGGFLDSFAEGAGKSLAQQAADIDWSGYLSNAATGAATGFAAGGIPGAIAGGIGGIAKNWLSNRKKLYGDQR